MFHRFKTKFFKVAPTIRVFDKKLKKKGIFATLIPLNFMDDDRFKIYVHRLKEGESEVISETFDPSFLQVDEKELKFEAPIEVNGTAYVSNNNFLLTMTVCTDVILPCVICNEQTKIALKAEQLVHDQTMEELKSGIFHMGEMIRQGLLLELPLTAECRDGKCPEREHLTKYFSKEN